MISVFQLFKIIFGLIASGFILYFAVHYISSYSYTQHAIQKAKVINNFIETAQDVYLSGNYINFTQFARYHFTPYFDTRKPEGLYSKDTDKISVNFPLFISPGEELFIDRKHICLLYTSPSPRDLSTSRMPSSA